MRISSRASSSRIVRLLLAGVCVLQACGEPAAPTVDSSAAASIELSSAFGALEPGEAMYLAVAVLDLTGRLKVSAAISWSLSDSSAMTIDASGLATALDVAGERTVKIVATHQALADSVEVSVVPVLHPTRRQPIVFVHGFGGSDLDFTPVVQRFRGDGWLRRELFAGNYSGASSNVNIAGVIERHIDSVRAATGWERIHIVSYSMGSLSSRYYIKELGGIDKIESWTSISGPNHGTSTANLCFSQPCIEMRPGSAFLNALNNGDETPGALRYATWWSPCDQLVQPPQSTILTGAQNTETACLPHAGMFTDEIYRQVRDFIRP